MCVGRACVSSSVCMCGSNFEFGKDRFLNRLRAMSLPAQLYAIAPSSPLHARELELEVSERGAGTADREDADSSSSSVVSNSYVPHDADVPEITIRALILSAILATILGAANVYLGLFAGMTVSASIPAAIMSMSILRSVFSNVSILENNIVQTAASAGGKY